MRRLWGFEIVRSMPVHLALRLEKVNLDQTTPARATPAGPGRRVIHGSMGGAHQPSASVIKKVISHHVHLHRHMGAAIEISVNLTLESDREGAASSPGINNLEGHCLARIGQIR